MGECAGSDVQYQKIQRESQHMLTTNSIQCLHAKETSKADAVIGTASRAGDPQILYKLPRQVDTEIEDNGMANASEHLDQCLVCITVLWQLVMIHRFGYSVRFATTTASTSSFVRERERERESTKNTCSNPTSELNEYCSFRPP